MRVADYDSDDDYGDDEDDGHGTEKESQSDTADG